MFGANFKTAYLQREIPENAIVIGDVVVGELVKVTAATDVSCAIVEKLVASTAAAAKTEATHIIAQSDMTLEYGHVPVENRDYRYSDKVKSSVDTTKLGESFLGYYASSSALPSSSSVVSSNDTALVFDATNKKLDLYVATVVSTTVTWVKATSTAAYSIAYDAAVKQVAMYKAYDKDDIIVYEA